MSLQGIFEPMLKAYFKKHGVNGDAGGESGGGDSGGDSGGAITYSNSLPIAFKLTDALNNNKKIAPDPESVFVKVSEVLADSATGYSTLLNGSVIFMYVNGMVLPMTFGGVYDMSTEDMTMFRIIYTSANSAYQYPMYCYAFQSAGALDGVAIEEAGVYMMDMYSSDFSDVAILWYVETATETTT